MRDRHRAVVPHRVGRLRFELDGGDEAALLRLRSTLVGGAESWIPAALDSALGELDDPDATLRIERLEVDLGLLPQAGLTPQLLSSAVRDSLARELRMPATGSAAPRKKTAPGTVAEALVFFLESGRLPWWSPVGRLSALEEEIDSLRPEELRALARAAAPALRRARAARRLVISLEPGVAARIAAQLPRAAAGTFEAEAWRAAAGGAAAEALAEQVSRAAGAGSPRRERTVAQPPDGGGREEPEGETPHPEVARRPERGDPSAGEAEEGVERALVVDDAGLVLLHPFLPALFEACGLAAAGRFTGEAARQRALRLTAFLASGEADAAEPELVMAKVLCGWPLDEPVSRSAGLTADDRAEAEELLRSVVGLWSALGSASPEALRETFLTRPGRVRDVGRAWRLEVERRGADVLLGRLPWALTPVRLPWMERPLHVDWA